MRVGLYLIGSKGLATLRAALAANVEIAHVTWAPATGIADESHTDIDRLAKQAGAPTFLRQHPPDHTADWSLAAGWRWMLPSANLVVLHDSLLPRYRGFAPLVTALTNGDPAVGVTAFLADEHEYDSGPIVRQRTVAVTYPARMAEVLGRVNSCYAAITDDVLDELRVTGTLRSVPQDHSAATYSVWRDEDDYRIDWTRDDRTVQRLVDACSHPFPGAWTTRKESPWNDFDRQIVRILDAVVERDTVFEQRHPGKVAFVRDGDPVVVCGQGMLRVLATDPPGALTLRTRLS